MQTSGKALIGGPFTLVDQTGKTVTDQDFRGRYMLVFFGFTHCPDICPAELQVMSAALDALGPKADSVVPIFITLDPERDTPAADGRLRQEFRPALRRSHRLCQSRSPQPPRLIGWPFRNFSKTRRSSDYSIDHSALVYLMGKNGEYITHFAYGTPASQMTETLRRYL